MSTNSYASPVNNLELVSMVLEDHVGVWSYL